MRRGGGYGGRCGGGGGASISFSMKQRGHLSDRPPPLYVSVLIFLVAVKGGRVSDHAPAPSSQSETAGQGDIGSPRQHVPSLGAELGSRPGVKSRGVHSVSPCAFVWTADGGRSLTSRLGRLSPSPEVTNLATDEGI